MHIDIDTYLKAQRQNVDYQLSQVLKSLVIATPKPLFQAMSYSLLAPGKRVRPILALATCEMLSGDVELCGPIACAVEMIHTYSLVQDDLPCMDNDDYRRGQLTCHRVFGEGLALLGSDALLTEAIRLVLGSSVSLQVRHQVALELLGAIGSQGMVGGQALDISSSSLAKNEHEVEQIHQRKTGALLTASVRCGALVGKATEVELLACSEYGKMLGTAFQVVDDILDATSSLKQLGKNPRGDIRNKKTTYVDLLGVEGAKARAKDMVQAAIASLYPLGSAAFVLKEIAHRVLQRV